MTVVLNPKLADGEVVHDKVAAICYVKSEREAELLMARLNAVIAASESDFDAEFLSNMGIEPL